MARIVTFYSYKGGTGRSMALANVAWILASNGRRVLTIDWDLEAPGLHHYFRPFFRDPDLRGYDVRGVIDFVFDYAAMAATPVPDGKRPAGWHLPYADISQCAIPLRWPSGEALRMGGNGEINFVAAGRQDPSTYADRVNGFDWRRFYEKQSGGAFIDAVRERMQQYDYVLIDSRTGVSDTSGICTVQLPDVIVLCFTLNNQSISGAARVAASIAAQSPGKLVLPVPCRVDPFEKEKLNRRRQVARRVFEQAAASVATRRGVPPEAYWDAVEIPYFASYSYEEVLAPFEEFTGSVGSMLPALERLTDYVTGGSVRELRERVSDPLREQIINLYRGTAPPEGLESAEPGSAPAAAIRRSAAHARNIVLLSDGTGNSAAKLMKTNVWRIYEALDVSAGDQLAMYDNGVGSSSFKPLSILGGAVGFGLKRNVLDLYTFACRNYRPGTDGGAVADQLYAFGFSRGAFTVRVLVGLIEDQGLITGFRGQELDRLARWAYRRYRRRFNTTGGLVTPLRALRDSLLRAWDGMLRRFPYDGSRNLRPRIRFMGLWDTVDAYGLPIDEMTRGWDQWVWPLSIADRSAPAIVDKVCHAVSLDDERQTFHPVLFDESSAQKTSHIDEERVTQIWFAGVHSNVGGGYADDSLAFVSLRWMAEEAAKAGLRLNGHVAKPWEARADPHGPLYDSRKGLGSWYRYNPRNLKLLTWDRFAAVEIARPKIHESAFERIVGGRDDYAPIVLPERYAVVTAGGALLEGDKNPYEDPSQSASRCADQERIANRVWLRRVLYFATVFLTFFIIAPPFLAEPAGTALLDIRSQALSSLIDVLARVTPALLQPWIDFYRPYPLRLFVPAVTVGVLLVLSTIVQRSIRDRMRRVWDEVVAAPPRAVQPSWPPTDWIYRVRTSRYYRQVMETVTQRIFPFVFGVGTLVVLVLAAIGTLSRAGFAAASATGTVCRAGPAARELLELQVPRVFALSNRELCHDTGATLVQGGLYRFEIALPDGGWRDRSLLVATPAGFASGRYPALLPFLPFRRVLTEQWFVPMARIGQYAAEYQSLNAPAIEIAPRITGPLFLFVNDAVAPWPGYDYFYRNNDGGVARITVMRVR